MANSHRPASHSITKIFVPVTEMVPARDLVKTIFYSHENSALTEPVEMGHAQLDFGRSQRDPIESLPPQKAITMKRNHWKSTGRSDFCVEPSCHKKFSKLDKKRNCAMCGDVFCKNCTRFTRKLSSNALPDPLGVSCHVCHTCLMDTVQTMGQEGDWTQYFSYIRDRKKKVEEQNSAQSQSKPLTQLNTAGRSKRDRLCQELERLKIGYETQTGWVKSIVSEIKIPSWQKSRHWVDPSNAHQCRRCHEAFGKKVGKNNCRVCGQVYCSSCISKDELMVFMMTSSHEAQWAINGKTGAPEQKPRSFVLLKTCKMCATLLEEVLIEEFEGPPEEEWDAQEDFMDSLANLEAILFKSRLRIESLLPQYQKLVDSMDVVDGSPRSTHSKSPIHDLACSQSNLSDNFSQLATDSQKLRLLEPVTPTQGKLLKHVTVSIYRFYEDNMYMFRVCRKRLALLMPIETIEIIQKIVNKISIERVHVFMRQITFEAMNLEIKYNLVSSNITAPLAHCLDTFEFQLEKYFEEIKENWVKHSEAVQQMVREDYEGSNPEGKIRRRIKLPSKVPKTPFRNVLVQRKILAQCSHYIYECLRELDAKTPDSFFKSLREEMKQLAENFDNQISKLIQNHPHVFKDDSKAQLEMNDYASGYRS